MNYSVFKKMLKEEIESAKKNIKLNETIVVKTSKGSYRTTGKKLAEQIARMVELHEAKSKKAKDEDDMLLDEGSYDDGMGGYMDDGDPYYKEYENPRDYDDEDFIIDDDDYDSDFYEEEEEDPLTGAKEMRRYKRLEDYSEEELSDLKSRGLGYGKYGDLPF